MLLACFSASRVPGSESAGRPRGGSLRSLFADGASSAKFASQLLLGCPSSKVGREGAGFGRLRYGWGAFCKGRACVEDQAVLRCSIRTRLARGGLGTRQGRHPPPHGPILARPTGGNTLLVRVTDSNWPHLGNAEQHASNHPARGQGRPTSDGRQGCPSHHPHFSASSLQASASQSATIRFVRLSWPDARRGRRRPRAWSSHLPCFRSACGLSGPVSGHSPSSESSPGGSDCSPPPRWVVIHPLQMRCPCTD